ncbi:MAG: hypothetical protein HZA78_12715, partial [Candidatus Schekmanbacteria bacterium]|nr:hypothetical protein [Candidatus Schekmanbacteria bacterium]
MSKLPSLSSYIKRRVVNMQVLEAKQKLEEIINKLSEDKLAEVIDFASYLRDKEEAKELLKMQKTSKAYQDWLSPENDIY